MCYGMEAPEDNKDALELWKKADLANIMLCCALDNQPSWSVILTKVRQALNDGANPNTKRAGESLLLKVLYARFSLREQQNRYANAATIDEVMTLLLEHGATIPNAIFRCIINHQEPALLRLFLQYGTPSDQESNKIEDDSISWVVLKNDDALEFPNSMLNHLKSKITLLILPEDLEGTSLRRLDVENSWKEVISAHGNLCELILIACAQGNLNFVNHALQKSISINLTGEIFMKGFIRAALNNQVDVIKTISEHFLPTLIQKDTWVALLNKALLLATVKGHLSIIKLILEIASTYGLTLDREAAYKRATALAHDHNETLEERAAYQTIQSTLRDKKDPLPCSSRENSTHITQSPYAVLLARLYGDMASSIDIRYSK